LEFYQSNKKWTLIGSGILAAVVIAVVMLFSRGSSASEGTQVVYVDVTSGAITESIDVVGSLEAVPSVTLSWESIGIVSSFDLKVGDKVEKDQILMTLEDSSLASSILQAQTDLLDAQAVLENIVVANMDLHLAAQVLADAEYALIDYKADRDYYNSKGASWDTVEKAREEYYAMEQIVWVKESAYDALSHLDADDPERLAAYEERKAAIEESDKYHHYLSNILGTYYDHAVETDFIQYDQALADVEEARIAYNRYLDQTEEIAAAEANVQALQNIINQSKIIAPFAGTVTEVNAVSGELASSGKKAVRIDNLDNLMVDIYVSEVDINKVETGQPVILTFDALTNQKYTGFVDSISSAGSDESGVVEFRVSVKLEDADGAVKPGFTSVVSIITSQVENALLVPTQAILSQKGVSVVMRVNADGSTTAVPVELGATSDVHMQVISGDLAVGDKLAVTLTTSTNEIVFDGSLMRDMNKVTGSGPGSGQKPE
ncbi:MAG: efflux RND transporter periplasmic adaptor subunit, partial [Pelolinea sp.]|nr:efflux RND transporter periplasmic adaptor subunit [Pelolinea sp.]